MFTLGIFTTHLPYIALVVFYAFFWIHGVTKASSGELQAGDSSIKIEISAQEHFVETTGESNYDFQDFTGKGFLPPDYNIVFSAFQKLKHKELYVDKHWHSIVNPALFSRPPPFLS